MKATGARIEQFTTGQVAKLTGVTHRQLDHWAWSGFLPPSGGVGGTAANAWRRYTFEDLIRIRTVAELRRQGVSLQVVRKAVERLQQYRVDPLHELKLVAVAGEVYVFRSWKELERATDGQLAFTLVNVGALLRQLEGQIAALHPRTAERPRPARRARSAKVAGAA